MLLKTLYVWLPYFYILAGASLGITFESPVILLSSVLLMLAGFVVLWMRRHSKNLSVAKSTTVVRPARIRNWNDIFQAEQERRMVGLVRSFPLIDSSGNIVSFDRRQIASRNDTEAA